MLEAFINFLLEMTATWGYGGVFFLMTIESSFVPFPSEIVVPPAAFLAAKGEMNIWIVILVGTLGSLVGALINYYLALWLGRPLVFTLLKKRWARYFLLSESKMEKAEAYFLKHGGVATFVGRLIPGIRQLISLPAGFSRMSIAKFVFFTSLGAGIWVVVLAALGYFLGAQHEILEQYYGLISKGIFFAVVVLVVALVVFRGSRAEKGA